MDRRFPSVIAIAVIMSTLISFFVFVRSPEERITVIRNTAPDAIRRQIDLELSHKFVLGLVAREEIQELMIVYSFVVPSDPLPTPSGQTIGDWEETLPDYSTLSGLTRSLGHEPEAVQGSLPDDEGDIDYVLLDIGEALSVLTDPGLSEDATSVHLIIVEEGTAKHWTGKDGFYYHRSQLSKVTISRSEDEITYVAQRSAQELKPGESPIEESPSNGRIRFADVLPDETISVILEIDGRADQPQGSASLIRVYVDRELDRVLVNFMS